MRRTATIFHGSWSTTPQDCFAACRRLGEFFSLTLGEFSSVSERCSERDGGVARRCWLECGYGTTMAKEFARAAEDAGADGILLLPPYLVNAEAAGLAAHVEAVCTATNLGVIVYNRDNAIIDDATLAGLCERCPNLIGFKDGVGDIELMTRIYARLGDRLIYIGGLPTAETFALPYLEMGVTTYSSAIFNFRTEVCAGVLSGGAAARSSGRSMPACGILCCHISRSGTGARRPCSLDRKGGNERRWEGRRGRCARRWWM